MDNGNKTTKRTTAKMTFPTESQHLSGAALIGRSRLVPNRNSKKEAQRELRPPRWASRLRHNGEWIAATLPEAPEQRRRLSLAITVWAILFIAWPPCLVLGQAPQSDSRPLVDQVPYDLLTLNEQNGGRSFKVLPLSLTGQTIPADPEPTASIRIRLIENDEKEYEVFWRDISQVELFQKLLLREAERLTDAGEFGEAFRCYAVLFEK